MWLNSYDSGEDINISWNVSEKVQEQYSEQTKQARIQLKKIQKDEKLAKWDDQKLFLILSRFINDSYYESLIDTIVSFLQMWVPSRAIIAMISLFYPDATFFVADSLGKKEKLNLLLSLPRHDVVQFFDEKNIHPAISGWMSEWIILMESFLVGEDSSMLMVKKYSQILSSSSKNIFEENFCRLLVFFFETRNIKIDDNTAMNYTRFILKNTRNNLDKFLEMQSKNVQELIADATIEAGDLFG